MDDSAPDAAIYGAWVPVQDVFARLSDLHYHEAEQAILTALIAGVVAAKAGTLVHRNGEKTLFADIPKGDWEHARARVNSTLWKLGQLEFRKEIGTWQTVPGTQHLKTVFAVRLDPKGLATIWPEFGSDAQPRQVEAVRNKTHRRSRPKKADVQRFCAAYIKKHGDRAVEGEALSAIRAQFPDHDIGRDWFRDFFRMARPEPAKRGNPAFR